MPKPEQYRARVARPKRAIVATCEAGCEIDAREGSYAMRRHVARTGHMVTVTDTRSIRFIPELDG